MSTPDTQSLVSAPSQHANVDIETPRAQSARTYKVVGITVLACALIMGQAAIAYFLVNQSSDIKSLQNQNKEMRSQLTKSRSVAVPMRMQMPINSLTADFLDEESSTKTTKKVSVPLTTCQLENAGVKPMQVPGFRPACDKDGLYEAQQCFMKECWCVNTSTGEQIPGSSVMGQAKCGSTDVATTALVSDDFE